MKQPHWIKKELKNIFNAVQILAIAFVLSMGMSLVYAMWSSPTQAPTGGNTPTPINVGNTTQLKSGNLVLMNGLLVPGGDVGIGTNSPTQKLDVRGHIRSTGQNIVNNSSPTVHLQDTDHRSGMIHVNSNLFYVLRGCGTNSTGWCTFDGRWPLVINLNNNNATFGGDVHVAGNLRITGGNPGPGKVLMSDAHGNASWQTTAATVGGGATMYTRVCWRHGCVVNCDEGDLRTGCSCIGYATDWNDGQWSGCFPHGDRGCHVNAPFGNWGSARAFAYCMRR